MSVLVVIGHTKETADRVIHNTCKVLPYDYSRRQLVQVRVYTLTLGEVDDEIPAT